MKQLIILLLLIILTVVGFGQYNTYQRFTAKNSAYVTSKKLDFNYYNQAIVLDYFEAVEDLNSFVTLQWTVNDIDVRAPENDAPETVAAQKVYAKKLAAIKFYESKLENAATLKDKGFDNEKIKFLHESGSDSDSFQKKEANSRIKQLFNPNKVLKYGEKNPLIFEVQKKLIANGYDILLDGILKKETMTAIKHFEEKNNLFADGTLDLLTLDVLFR
ncbi:peptidoglycan-binding domain-containing protein [Polaribacter tangerinus]|uniref:peptidoglycan-binding domain-containing protein n=1 Tax=Polaribacter tangerinus TaxID=1920034 RepID=UPI000B4AEFDE|nr:peptidoglycan-binding domain-containing protein [Polaribacter tangerinus]